MKMETAMAALAVAACAPLLPGAAAQAPERVGEFERGFGLGYGAMEDPIEVSNRDAAGNRLVVDGYIVPGGDLSSLPLGLFGQSGSSLDGPAMAIGNQLNVVVQGSWNTVVIDNTQINSGDQTATLEGGRQ